MNKKLTIFLVCLISLIDAAKIIIIRHGQGTHNLEGLYNSNPNNPNYTVANLTEEGKKQVERSAKKLLSYGINKNNVSKIYVSPLPRTVQTAEILIKNGVASSDKMLIDKRLIERQTGSREGHISKEFNYDEINGDYSKAHSYGGETAEDVRRRISAFHTEIKKLGKNQNIVVVTHETPSSELINIISGKNTHLDTAGFEILSI